MDQDDHVAAIETSDTMTAIRESLPEGHCQSVFDIDSGSGDEYSRFSGEYGDREPKKCHIAKFLGITPRAVSIHREIIKVQCLAHELGPCI